MRLKASRGRLISLKSSWGRRCFGFADRLDELSRFDGGSDDVRSAFESDFESGLHWSFSIGAFGVELGSGRYEQGQAFAGSSVYGEARWRSPICVGGVGVAASRQKEAKAVCAPVGACYAQRGLAISSGNVKLSASLCEHGQGFEVSRPNGEPCGVVLRGLSGPWRQNCGYGFVLAVVDRVAKSFETLLFCHGVRLSFRFRVFRASWLSTDLWESHLRFSIFAIVAATALFEFFCVSDGRALF